MTKPLKIAFVLNNVGAFATHRLPFGRYLVALGHEVHLFVGQDGSATSDPWGETEITAAGISVTKLPFETQGLNLCREGRGLIALKRALKAYDPDFIHSVSPKGNVYSGLALRMMSPRPIVFAISGLGYVFTKSDRFSLKQFLVRQVYKLLFRLALRQDSRCVLVQNLEDLGFMKAKFNIPDMDCAMVGGVGVDTDALCPGPELDPPTVLFPARLLIDKGVREFFLAAKILKARYPHWRFLICGSSDYQNPKAISSIELAKWQDEGVVEFVGFQTDMRSIYGQSCIVCLPSYREGFPRVLMEAAASGLPVVSTTVPGCRDAVLEDRTGILVPPQNVDALVDALDRLICSPGLRREMGAAGRGLALEKFRDTAIHNDIFRIYQHLLSR